MLLKNATAVAAALSLAVTPTLASAQAAPIQPAGETVEGSELRGGFIIPLIAIIAIILGILAATHNDDDPPHSP